MEERTFTGEPGTSPDVTIILVHTGGSRDRKLALIHLDSHVLTTHSNYFLTCLSERWKKPATSPSPSMEFVLETQTDVQYYFDCFSNMYSPSYAKTFKGMEHGVELLKVASQIDFQGLMESISLYLSSMLWTEEDEIRVREYSASPDFPRLHLKELVVRLGLDAQSKEDRQKQLGDLIRECTRAALKASIDLGAGLPTFLQGIGRGPPSEFSSLLVAIVSQEALRFFKQIGNDWDVSSPSPNSYITKTRIRAMCWILEALLKGQVAEELVQGIVHLSVIPNCIVNMARVATLDVSQKKLAELVLLMYQEVAAGRLPLRPAERVALLENWHVVMQPWLRMGSFEQATTNVFLTLPMKQQTDLMKLHQERVYDYIGNMPLISLVAKHSHVRANHKGNPSLKQGCHWK